MFWDVTDRVQAERAAAAGEERHRAIVDAALDCIVIADRDGRLLEFNPAAERTFRLKQAEVLGKELFALAFPADQAESHRRAFRGFQGGEPWDVAERRQNAEMLRGDGEPFTAEVVMRPVPQPGQTLYTFFLRDVTLRRRMEEQLRRSNARLERLREADIIGLTVDSRDGTIVEANDQFLKTVGLTRPEFEQDPPRWDRLSPPEYAEADRAAGECLAATGRCAPAGKGILPGRRQPRAGAGRRDHAGRRGRHEPVVRAGHLRPEGDRGATPRGEGGGRDRQPGQVRLPGEHVPTRSARP